MTAVSIIFLGIGVGHYVQRSANGAGADDQRMSKQCVIILMRDCVVQIYNFLTRMPVNLLTLTTRILRPA